ncbi:ComEA family DNA-binding protein [Nocardioides allogilvus]|uniref:ComEA family DNA-binding protein n=1 Tax=Nocardioides allogilvus TaxID=2072017 RepID=UPI000D316B9B|nr:ComEA family DNA-binding protein [Nocardioides allogilvus]
MRPLHPRSTTSDEHAEAVSRRLATLSAELAAVRRDPPVAHRHTQLRGLHPEPPPDLGEVPLVPVPGRHSSRGPVHGLVSRLHLTGAHVAVISIVVAVAVAVASWLAVRSDPEPVPALAPVSEPLVSTSPVPPGSPASIPPGPATGTATGTATGPAEVTVDVAGKVRSPGIAVLPPGSRVVDAVEAAGGARRGVDLASLNLARPLVDGEQILVGLPVPAGVVGSLGATPGPGQTGPLVNLNTADPVTLETLPGVGPVTAGAIVSWRTEHGGFTAVEELLEVDGIGDATLAEIAPHVTI